MVFMHWSWIKYINSSFMPISLSVSHGPSSLYKIRIIYLTKRSPLKNASVRKKASGVSFNTSFAVKKTTPGSWSRQPHQRGMRRGDNAGGDTCQTLKLSSMLDRPIFNYDDMDELEGPLPWSNLTRSWSQSSLKYIIYSLINILNTLSRF